MTALISQRYHREAGGWPEKGPCPTQEPSSFHTAWGQQNGLMALGAGQQGCRSLLRCAQVGSAGGELGQFVLPGHPGQGTVVSVPGALGVPICLGGNSDSNQQVFSQVLLPSASPFSSGSQ